MVIVTELYFGTLLYFSVQQSVNQYDIFCYINALKVPKTFDAYIFFCHLLQSKNPYH